MVPDVVAGETDMFLVWNFPRSKALGEQREHFVETVKLSSVCFGLNEVNESG